MIITTPARNTNNDYNVGNNIMCKRCDCGRTGLKTLLDVREKLGMHYGQDLWIRVLDPLAPTDHPRYVVDGSGRVLALQEPGCQYWHLTSPEDSNDVNNSCPPVTGQYDTYQKDQGDTFLFDIGDLGW